MQIRRLEVATHHVEDHAVFETVARIAHIQNLRDDRLAIAVGERATGHRTTVRPFRRNAVQGDRDASGRQIRVPGSHRGRTGDDAVEVERIALRHQHGFAASGGTSHIVGMRRRPAVIALDDLPGQYRDAADGDEFEIQRGLLILHEGTVECTTRALMSGIGGGNGKAASERGLISGSLSAGWLADSAV